MKTNCVNDKEILCLQKCFTDGDLLQESTLLGIAEECGLDKEQAKSYISDKTKLEKVFEKAMGWAERGISGENVK